MKLSLDKVKEITTGAVQIQEENAMLSFKRFTHEQEELYKATSQDYYNNTFSTSGIKLMFTTDSKNLFLKFKTMASSSRKYFSVDVFVDGKCVGYIDNFSDMESLEKYTHRDFRLGDFSKNFQLPEGKKTVCVHFPWSVKLLIEEVSIDDNAYINAVKQKNKLLAYGDSITQGYDALRPSNRYIAKLADELDAEEFNKAIGGARFFPELAQLKDSFVPDYITVAYGTNDWNKTNEETFKKNCKAFYSNLSENYPESKIFAITPIWREDMTEDRIFGEFEKVEVHIRNAVENLKNITVISGFNFVPKEKELFADKKIHPNDEGFEYYFENLYHKIKSKI